MVIDPKEGHPLGTAMLAEHHVSLWVKSIPQGMTWVVRTETATLLSTIR